MYMYAYIIYIYIYIPYVCHMYQLIPLHSCDYLKKLSIQIKVATDEGNSRNEMWHWRNDEIGVALQSLLWVRIEFMAW